jgi:hypothetical protein
MPPPTTHEEKAPAVNSLTRWLRLAAALAAVIAVALSATATAGAAVTRPADTSDYTSAKYLRHALGLPQKSSYIIESVTYDRFQWLLKQPGKFAYLIGDPATDPSFKNRAQEVEAASETAGVKRVYWFNPNLSGNAQLGSVTQPNLDIRKPAGIASISTNSAGIYNTAWLHLIAQHLGNGVASAFGAGNNAEYASAAKVTATPDATVVNDYGSKNGFSTKVGDADGGALYQYTGGTAPTNVGDSYFFFYDKDNVVTDGDAAKPQKIASWVNLSKSATPAADVATAIALCGAASVQDIDEFHWWKASNNQKQFTQKSNDFQGADTPNLTDADGSAANGGWRVHQITYPELVYLLSTEDAKETVILFGGTWCPNTRPVLPSINKYAQEQDVTVFNFDTILDGGVVGGGNAGSNPLQSRNGAASGNPSVANANPSFIYGELVTHYLNNLKTEYKPDGSNKITYYPGGDSTQALTSQPRLQVPYLFGYRGAAGDAPHGGIVRQWIHDTGVDDAQSRRNYVEYMTTWAVAHPQADKLGILEATLPRDLPVWDTINAQLQTFKWNTDPASLKYISTNYSDVDQFVLPGEKATVTYVPPAGQTAAKVEIAVSTAAEAIAINEGAADAAVAALGAGAPATYTAARDALIAEKAKPDEEESATKIEHLRTIIGSWGTTESRKTTVGNLWGAVDKPGSLIGAAAALHAADVFFKGLPDRPKTEDPGNTNPNPGSTDPGTGGGTTTNTTTQPAGTPPAATPAATPKPSTSPSARKVTGKISGKATKVPTSTKRGTYLVKVTGKVKGTGKVTVKFKKGSVTKTLTGTLKNGEVVLSVPKLAKGTWKITISWPGDATYEKVTATGTLKVKR